MDALNVLLLEDNFSFFICLFAGEFFFFCADRAKEALCGSLRARLLQLQAAPTSPLILTPADTSC